METVIEFVVFVCQVVFWYWVASWVVAFLLSRNQANEQEKTELIAKLNTMVHLVNIEKHGDTYYWFDENNGDFLGQGKTSDEVINHIRSRFPTHWFFLPSQQKVHGPNWTIETYDIRTLSSDVVKLKNES